MTEENASHQHGDATMARWQQLLSGSSPLLDVLAAEVDEWEPVPAGEASWLTHTELPSGWQVIQVADDSSAPLRVAGTAIGDRPGWVACQALSAIRFNGTPSRRLLLDHADRALKEWGAQGIRTDLVLPETRGAEGVRSTGYIAADNQQFWVRHSTYLIASTNLEQGLVVEEIIAADGAVFRPPGPVYGELSAAFGALSEAIAAAFLNKVGLSANDVSAAKAAHAERVRAEASRAPLLTEEQRRFLSTALAMWGGPAGNRPLPVAALGYRDWADFDSDTDRLRARLDQSDPQFSPTEWTRILLLAEISFASNLLGAGVEFEIASAWYDPEALPLLRSIQRRLGPLVDPTLLFPDARR